MNFTVLGLVTAAIVGAVVWFVRSRAATTYKVRMADIPRVFADVGASTSFPTYAMLSFETLDPSGGTSDVSMQFSKEDERIGFDWILLAPRNIKDESRFAEYARGLGYSPERKEADNGVKYVRVEGGDLVKLCTGVMTSMYGISADTELELIAEGFEWNRDQISVGMSV
jgi:hypothetical protein